MPQSQLLQPLTQRWNPAIRIASICEQLVIVCVRRGWARFGWLAQRYVFAFRKNLNLSKANYPRKSARLIGFQNFQADISVQRIWQSSHQDRADIVDGLLAELEQLDLV